MILPLSCLKKTLTSLLFITTLASLTAHADQKSLLDSFGGALSLKGEATGWFHLQQINDRWFLITPQGHGMISIGVVHIGTQGPKDQFADESAFADDVIKKLRAWNFNSAGYGCTWEDQVEIGKRIPFFVSMELLPISGWLGNGLQYDDIFDPVVQQRIADQISRHCKPVKDNPNLIGYYWTDMPQYDLKKRRLEKQSDWVRAIRKLPANSPGRQSYAQFLQNRYHNDITAFEEKYGITIDAFDDLKQILFEDLAPTEGAIFEDDTAFLQLMVTRYYQLAYETTKQIDPHHLIFGDRYFRFDWPDAVVQKALQYIDVISIQPGKSQFDKAFYDKIANTYEKPIMLCDLAINFPTTEYPKTMAGQNVRDEAHAAQLYEDYLNDAFSQPYILGVHRCQYIDRIKANNVLKQGLIQQNGDPYALTVQRYSKTHENIYRTLY